MGSRWTHQPPTSACVCEWEEERWQPVRDVLLVQSVHTVWKPKAGILKRTFVFPSNFLPHLVLIVNFIPNLVTYQFPPTGQALPHHMTSTKWGSGGGANTCFLHDTWSQPPAPFQTAEQSASHGSATHSEQSAIRPLLHTWPHRCPWLAKVTVTDRGEKICPSHPDTTTSFALLTLGRLWHYQDSRNHFLLTIAQMVYS